MADEPPVKDNFVIWFLGIMGILFFVWIARGGPQNNTAQGVFLRPLSPIDSGERYGGTYLVSLDADGEDKIELPPPIINIEGIGDSVSNFSEKLREVELIHKAPMSSRTIIIDGFSGAQATNPQSEFIRVVANSKNRFPVPLTGLRVESSITGNKAVIPQGALLLSPGTIPSLQNILLDPTMRSIIETSKSPVGASFRVNICSGYFGQFQTYTPELRRECPRAEDDLRLYGIDDNVCENFLKDLPRCEIYRGTIPDTLSPQCKQFIKEKLNYNTCVALHKNDTGFYRDEWRVFLGKTTELWRQKQEIIKIVDPKGVVMDAVTY